MEEALREALNEAPKTSKRPLESPGTVPNTKKPDNTDRPDICQAVSDQLKEIRMNSSNENHSYIANSINPNPGPRYLPASKCSYAGTWDRGTTDVINVQILSINGEDYKGSYKMPEAMYVWTNILHRERELLHGISFKNLPRRPLQIVYRLKNPLLIDDLFSRDDFSYNRGEQKPDGSYDIVCGRILGMRKRNPPPRLNQVPSTPLESTFTGANSIYKKNRS